MCHTKDIAPIGLNQQCNKFVYKTLKRDTEPVIRHEQLAMNVLRYKLECRRLYSLLVELISIAMESLKFYFFSR